MPYYRLYLLDAHGHFLRVEEAMADDDSQAIDLARTIDHPQKIEVWQESRRVGIVEPEPSH
jgi:hypothetical protein